MCRREEEITIILVREGKPDKLMKRLAEKGCKIDGSVNGIYNNAFRSGKKSRYDRSCV